MVTGRRVTIEYILIKGLNDTPKDAKELSELISKLKCNVNLILYNENEYCEYKKPDRSAVLKFKCIVEASGKKVTVRLERGADIDAACGQLSSKYKKTT
jgi:23S rRNA (adenine2503-C2)-methyltransferase